MKKEPVNRQFWKKNFRKIPDKINRKLKTLGDDIIVSCVKKVSIHDIQNGKYSHLEMKIVDGEINYPREIIPLGKTGKYSRRNVEGVEIIRKDLPKTSKTFSWEAPNFGDWYYGSHTCSFDREVYEREWSPPREIEIHMETLVKDEKNGAYIIKFSVDEVLDKRDNLFEKKLLENLNILQENTGSVDVFRSKTTASEYLKTVYVDWEILPPGEKDETIKRIISIMKPQDETMRKKIVDRFNFFNRLKPLVYIYGCSGLKRYFGAKYSENLVVFENLEYGNAVYVMFENWKTLSRLSRIEILSHRNKKEFLRIIHNSGWEELLKKVILEKRS